MSNELSEFRLKASIQSGGTSNARLYRFVSTLIERYPERGSIVDVGAGTGTFLKTLRLTRPFSEKIAVDLRVPSGSDPEMRWYQSDLNETWSNIPAEQFDWVVAIEVIEHLENPRHFIRQCKRLLKKGGNLLITTPNNESIRALLSLVARGNFVDFLDTSYPAHITPMLQMDLKRVMKECSLEIVEAGFSNWGTMPFFTGVDWQKVSLGLLNGKRFSDQTYLLARRVT